MEEDALDEAEREAAAAAAASAAAAARSSAIQRDLPRPLVVNRQAALDEAAAGGGAGGGEGEAERLLGEAARLLATETLRLLEADASNDPPKGALDDAVAKPRKPLRPTEPSLLAAAKAMLAAEADAVRASVPDAGAGAGAGAAWARANEELAYVPRMQKYAPIGEVAPADRLAASEQQLQLLRNTMVRDGKRAAKVEKKLETLLGGYRKRQAALEKQCAGLHASVCEKRVELGCFEALQRVEELARPQRLAALEAFAREQVEREARLQARYAELTRTRRTLTEQLSARRSQQQ